MTKKTPAEVITDLQNNPDYIILNNVFSVPKFVKKVGKIGEERVVTETYTPKIFFEILSQLTPQHLLDSVGGYVSMIFIVKDFLASIEPTNSNNDYNHVINCIKEMQKIGVHFEDKKVIIGFPVITYFKYETGTGMIRLELRRELAEAFLAVKQSENFSFLKKYLFKLNSAQAIKFFPFFVSWRNKGMYEISLEAFKEKFNYNTDGYKAFNNIRIKVLEPAIKEINEKTDLKVSYKPLGENLEGARQRVSALQFFIKEKKKQLPLKKVVIEDAVFEEVKTPKIIVPAPDNAYLADILRVFQVFEPDRTTENIIDFLGAFDNQKAILEACLYAEQEQFKGHVIKNFRGYLVAGIPKGLGSGILEQRVKDQAKAQQVEQKKTTQADKATELENLLKEADILRGGYRTAMDMLLQNTPTNDKENVAAILRKKRVNYASRTLEEFESIMFIADYIDTFITTYPERFAAVQNTYQKAFDGLAVKIKELAPAKAKNLFHY
jgi:hypothetical protein